MQPLTLPLSVYDSNHNQHYQQQQLSPNNSFGWKSFNNHHGLNQYNTINQNQTQYVQKNNTNNHIHYAQFNETSMNNNNNNNNNINHAMDPWTYSQQLIYQQLIFQQQESQKECDDNKKEIIDHKLELLDSKKNIEKIFLNAKFVTCEVFNYLSSEIPKLTAHDIYEGFFVSSQPTGNEWDMILKIYWKNSKENKNYIKYYLVHQNKCLKGDRCSDLLIEKTKNGNIICCELEMSYDLFYEFDHILSYFYSFDIWIGDSHLIALYVLCDKLQLNGGILNELLYEIRKSCDKYHCVSYLLKAEELENEELIWLCGDSILQNLSTISYYEWLSIPMICFHRLIFQAVSGGIGKYSDFIVCELIVQYIKAVMSLNHDKAKNHIIHLDDCEIISVSINHCLPIIKICDVLFCDKKQKWRYQNLNIYQLCINKFASEFTPYHHELCQQLQGLSPITFSFILILAKHLANNALNLSLMAYKDGNHAAYFTDKHLKINHILQERKDEQQESLQIDQPQIVSPLEISPTSKNSNSFTIDERSPSYSMGLQGLSPTSIFIDDNESPLNKKYNQLFSRLEQ